MIINQLNQFLDGEYDAVAFELIEYLIHLLPIKSTLYIALPVEIQQKVTDSCQPVRDQDGFYQRNRLLISGC